MSTKDKEMFRAAWETARKCRGHTMTFYLPGMIRYYQKRGNYPAVSITGNRCQLQCEHCKGRLLEPMLKAQDPPGLKEMCRLLAHKGAHGVLLTGGSDRKGRLPWNKYTETIKEIKEETGLFFSAHTGFIGAGTAVSLKQAGVTQALIDVMGDDETATRIYHLKGLEQVIDSLKYIKKSGLELIPHIVAGLNYGRIKAEYEALKIIRQHRPRALVIVVLTPLPQTPMADVSPPSPLEIGRLIAKARLMMPQVPISLGCERPRNRDGWLMEKLAILAGADRMAVWSEEAVQMAVNLGLTPRFQSTCCSLDYIKDFSLT